MITFENDLTASDYNMLRKSVGFTLLSDKQAQQGIEHTTFLVTAKDNGYTVGMARILFDYGYTAYIADVIVLPQYQGKGIGRTMVEQLLEFVKSNSEPTDFLSLTLNAAQGKEGFYEKLGFVKRPCGNYGAGMTKRIN